MQFSNTSKIDKIKRWIRVCKKTGKCPLCPKHKGENYRCSRKHKYNPKKRK